MRIAADDYRRWTADLPAALMDGMVETWGEAPGRLFVNDGDEIVLATIRAGNVVLMIQPPRGFGENPVAIYHDPDLPPSHHYLAAYRWVGGTGFGAHAVVHLGKHGSMEWLPGKNAALSASCATDAALGNLPLIYPFLVNDPGEGAQAKRRAHATIVDHLVPPMARAESYGDIARLEQLLDEYGNIATMDPAKLPAIRGEIWQLMHAAEMHRDLGLERASGGRDVRRLRPPRRRLALRDQGRADPRRPARARRGTGRRGAGQPGAVDPARRPGVGRPGPGGAGAAGGARPQGGGLEDRANGSARSTHRGPGSRAGRGDGGRRTGIPRPRPVCTTTPRCSGCWRSRRPRWCRAWTGRPTSSDAVLHALDGGFVPAGPSGSPLRGLVNVLPTGRNFYTVDPRAVPSRLAWQTGQAMADSLLQRYRDERAATRESVGLSVWGTSAMRTSGDDIAEVLALLGVRPEWDEASRRVSDL